MEIINKSSDVFMLFKEFAQRDEFNIYIYGARNAAKRFYFEMRFQGLLDKVSGFLVADSVNNPKNIEGKEVYSISSDDINVKCAVVVTADKRHWKDIENALLSSGFLNIYYVEEGALIPIYNETSMEIFKEVTGSKYTLENSGGDSTYMKLMFDAYANQYCMVSAFFGVPYDEMTRNFVRNYTFEHEFYKIFGSYKKVADLEPVNGKEDTDKIHIYMVTSHLNRATWDGEMKEHLIPIQAGAQLTESVCCEVRDNTDDNISARNQSLGEMTATYWVWKNSESARYKGICHYRRHFDISEVVYKNIVGHKIDAVLCTPRFVLPNNIDNFIRMNLVDKEAVLAMLKIIEKKAPHYYECAKEHLEHNMFYPCNMVIAKEQVFNDYCEFVFSVLIELDDYIKEHRIKTKERCAAYLAELLTSIYFVYQKEKLKIVISDYQLIE